MQDENEQVSAYLALSFIVSLSETMTFRDFQIHLIS